MFEFLTSSRRGDAGPLAGVAAADKFWRLLPQNDPFAAQVAVSDALSGLSAQRDMGRDPLRALLALDHHARGLGDALLVNYATRDPQRRLVERRYWRAAVALSQSFASGLEQFLRHFRNEPDSQLAREYAPAVLLRLFQHRQVEYLLRPFLNLPPVSGAWTELHAAYQFALARALHHHTVETRRSHEVRATESTLEREYIHVLLLDLMSGGQFAPYDAFWVSRWIPRWSEAVSLQLNHAGAPSGGNHFIVELEGPEGPKRGSPLAMGPTLHVDPSVLLAQIGAEIEALRDLASALPVTSTFGRARQVKLLRKVAVSYTPQPARVSRRGERKSVAATAKAVIGLTDIMRMLRHEEKKKIAAAPAAVPEVEEITITVDGGYTNSPVAASDDTEGPRGSASAFEFGVPHHVWQLKDRSVSGCRLRAPAGDAHQVHPGTLVAIRDDESLRWSLVVVRRIKTRIGDRVDIGVEYVGQNPRGVTMAIGGGGKPSSGGPARTARGNFTGVYLRESAKQPVMPFKTLIMAPSEFNGNRYLALRSATSEYAVRLKEPIEEQDDFVWLPYEVLDRRVIESPLLQRADDGKASVRRHAQPQAFPPGPNTATDWLAPQTAKRASGGA